MPRSSTAAPAAKALTVGDVSVSSSLISGNTAPTGANILNTGTFRTQGNNLLGSDGNAGVVGVTLGTRDIIATVPLSAILNPTLQDNGGPTPTLALVDGSPAIDAGRGSGPDQRGEPVVNGVRDIGAFELARGGPPGPAGPTDEGRLDCVSGDCNPPSVPNPESEAADVDEEVSYVQEFEDYLDVEAAAFEDFDALNRAEALTGVAPALIYARFVTGTEEVVVAAAIAPTKGLETDEAERSLAPAEESPAIAPSQEPRLELVLVTADHEPRRFRTGATRSEVLAAVQRLHLELTDRTRRRLDHYQRPAQDLYGWLLAPLEETLAAEEIGHVSFILDEGLRSIPLAALHDGEQFIIENYSVGLMPSLSLTDTRIGNIRNASVLAMGASEFSDQPPLPAVPLELSAIASQWAGAEYLNETFTPERVVQARNQAAYPVLHLATHGQFTSGGLDNSYIQFWDRRLSLDELPQLQLSDPAVELLVLSACRTVIGNEEAELGFAGLAIKSGAKTAIAALWQVSDLETAGLMAELYTQLGQVTYKAEALRQAQLAMLRGEVTVTDGYLTWSGGQTPVPESFRHLTFADTRHPFYWSAFTLVGSPW
jgi:CHAT domain-containing protein